MRLHLFVPLLFFISSPFAFGQLPFDPDQYSDPSQLISDELTQTIVQAIGLAVDHRPYQSATPLGNKLGLDLGLELTLVGVPDRLNDLLEDAGLDAGEIPPSIPIPVLHVHKGIGERFDLGMTYIKYQIYRIIGGNIKIALHVPEEGFIWAWRINYATSSIGFLETRTWSSQLLISRPFAYFDTYLGVGYQYAWGKVSITETLPDPINTDITLTNEARTGAFMALVGAAMRLWKTGIKLTLEGSYNSKGSHYMGMKFGVQW